MSNLTLITGQWHDNINQVEKVEPILGGASGNANLATRQLAENILWLKQQMANQINEAYAVGDIYMTTIKYPDAAAVAAHHGYGTWARYAEGRTVVGQSTQAADPDDYKTIGNTFGENKHKLTIEEMPSHTHDITINADDTNGNYPEDAAERAGYFRTAITEATGGDQPHNNIQPSIVAGCWLRTA